MKLPRSKQKELKEKGKTDSPRVSSDRAMGRLREFEQQRGIDETNLSNPTTSKAKKTKAQKRKK